MRRAVRGPSGLLRGGHDDYLDEDEEDSGFVVSDPLDSNDDDGYSSVASRDDLPSADSTLRSRKTPSSTRNLSESLPRRYNRRSDNLYNLLGSRNGDFDHYPGRIGTYSLARGVPSSQFLSQSGSDGGGRLPNFSEDDVEDDDLYAFDRSVSASPRDVDESADEQAADVPPAIDPPAKLERVSSNGASKSGLPTRLRSGLSIPIKPLKAAYNAGASVFGSRKSASSRSLSVAQPLLGSSTHSAKRWAVKVKAGLVVVGILMARGLASLWLAKPVTVTGVIAWLALMAYYLGVEKSGVFHSSSRAENKFWMFTSFGLTMVMLFAPDSPLRVPEELGWRGGVAGTSSSLFIMYMAHVFHKRSHHATLARRFNFPKGKSYMNIVEDVLREIDDGRENAQRLEDEVTRALDQLESVYLPSGMRRYIFGRNTARECEQKIIEVFMNCSKAELNYLLLKLNLNVIIYRLKNHSKPRSHAASTGVSSPLLSSAPKSHEVQVMMARGDYRNALVYILAHVRINALTTSARAALLDAIQVVGMFRNHLTNSFTTQLVAEILLHTRGPQLSELKTMTDSKGSIHSIHKLIYGDITDETIRARLLSHFEEQSKVIRAFARIEFQDTSGPAVIQHLRKIVSDVDDTLMSSGGRYPAGIDGTFPRHTIYPGAHAFYVGLDAAFMGGGSRTHVPNPLPRAMDSEDAGPDRSSSTAMLEADAEAPAASSAPQHRVTAASSSGNEGGDDEMEELGGRTYPLRDSVDSSAPGLPNVDVSINANGDLHIEPIDETSRPIGNLVFLSARPHVYKDMSEKRVYAKFERLVKDQILHAMPTLLPGDMESGQAYMLKGDFGPMSMKKLQNLIEFHSVYPEYTIIFVGDNGQGDLRAAELMHQRLGSRVLEAVFIHEVQPLDRTYGFDHTSYAKWREMKVVFYKTFVFAALKAYEMNLMRVDQLRRVCVEAVEDFEAVPRFYGGNLGRESARLMLSRDLEHASIALCNNGLDPVQPPNSLCAHRVGMTVYTRNFGEGWVKAFRPSDGIYTVTLFGGQITGYFSTHSLSSKPFPKKGYATTTSATLTHITVGSKVQTPYGPGVVRRFRPHDMMFEVTMTNWNAVCFLRASDVSLPDGFLERLRKRFTGNAVTAASTPAPAATGGSAGGLLLLETVGPRSRASSSTNPDGSSSPLLGAAIVTSASLLGKLRSALSPLAQQAPNGAPTFVVPVVSPRHATESAAWPCVTPYGKGQVTSPSWAAGESPPPGVMLAVRLEWGGTLYCPSQTITLLPSADGTMPLRSASPLNAVAATTTGIGGRILSILTKGSSSTSLGAPPKLAQPEEDGWAEVDESVLPSPPETE